MVIGGPTDKAGIQGMTKTVTTGGQSCCVRGGIILSLGRAKVVGPDGLASYVEENMPAGQTVQLGIVTSDAYTSASMVLGAYLW